MSITRRDFLSGSIAAIVAFRMNPAYGKSREKKIMLGTTVVDIIVTTLGPGPVYVNLHHDEDTSVMAAGNVITQYGGTLVVLKHSGKRDIQFSLKNIRYRFDPNRIFTDVGIKKTLNSRGNTYSKEAHAAVRSLADAIVEELLFRVPRTRIIALHNNGDGGGLDIRSFMKNGVYERDAKSVHQGKGDPDNFFYVTERRVYEYLAARGQSVVLQSDTTLTDDGSLSVRAAREGVSYINVEAEEGKLKEQREMLEIVATMPRLSVHARR